MAYNGRYIAGVLLLVVNKFQVRFYKAAKYCVKVSELKFHGTIFSWRGSSRGTGPLECPL